MWYGLYITMSVFFFLDDLKSNFLSKRVVLLMNVIPKPRFIHDGFVFVTEYWYYILPIVYGQRC